jgi:phosphoheptose isomerase
MFERAIEAHLEVIQTLRQDLSVIQQIAEKMSCALLEGHKILWCGNGSGKSTFCADTMICDYVQNRVSATRASQSR